MPIIYKTITPAFRLGVWDVQEPESFFLENFDYSSEELNEIDLKHGTHRLQLLASRAVLYDMPLSNNGYKIIKDGYGKPHIVNVQGDISFTHSHNQAAAIYAKHKLVGIDIQIQTQKISRIAPKFISPNEFKFINEHENKQDYYHLIWGAKESMYKAYGRRKVDFKDNLIIDPFVYDPKGHKISGRVIMPDYSGDFDIYYTRLGDYYLVYCIEQNIHET